VAGLGGCGAAPSSESLRQPLAQAASAARTTALALTQLESERITRPAAATVAGDMFREADTALSEARRQEARTPAQAGQRDAAASALDRAASALAHARDALAHDGAGPPPAEVLAEVRGAVAGIDETARQLGAEAP
jgi:hypothetical protein